MKMFFQLFFATTIISVLPVFATADFVQNDFSIGSSMTSDRYYANSGATDYGIEVAENFNNVSVNSATEALNVTWWGSVETGTNLTQFGLRLYNPNGITPSVPSNGAFLAANISPTSTYLFSSLGGRDIYRYETTLSGINLNGAQEYFVSIYGFGTQTDPGSTVTNPYPGSGAGEPDPNGFQWLSATDQLLPTGEAFREFPLNGNPWTATNGGTSANFSGRAMSLETVALPTNVPEPGAMCLLAMTAFGGLGYRRSWKTKS